MPEERILARAKVERIGEKEKGIYTFSSEVTAKNIKINAADIPDYRSGIEMFLKDVIGAEKVIPSLETIDAVGFKTVLAFGFTGVHELTDEVMRELRARLDIAPLHNKAYYDVITTFQSLCPNARLIGAFETAFHTERPLYAKIYGIPYSWYEKDRIYRYGMHGASHGYIADRVREIAGENKRIINCHLGGSSSVCAIRDGRSIDISSGFSPQTGLPHANRTGDLDIYALVYKLKHGEELNSVLTELTTNGGLLGMSGVSKDMRDIELAASQGNERAQMTIDMLSYQIAKFIGSYYVALEGLDYLVFTGGIGENSAVIRENVCKRLECLGIHMDAQKNLAGPAERCISSVSAGPQVWIIPTDEEVRVARQIMTVC